MPLGVHALQVVDVEVKLGFIQGLRFVWRIQQFLMAEGSARFFILPEVDLCGVLAGKGKGARPTRHRRAAREKPDKH